MTESLASLEQLLTRKEDRLRTGGATAPAWPTGFEPLDGQLGGGLRPGELTLLTGPQGLGKTTWAIQAARNVVASGGRVAYFSFEHEHDHFLERLLALEAFRHAGLEAPTTRRLRERMERGANRGGVGLDELLDDLPGVPEALSALRDGADRFHVHQASGRSTTVRAMTAVLDGLDPGVAPLVVVDYLQKVAGDDQDPRETVEALKDLAMERGVPVLALVAASSDGITPGQRMRLHQMRGSSALAYEPDVVLVLNDKYDVVARHHLVYDLGNAERYRDWVVLSIEKSRSGRDHVDLEFRKHFAHSCFDPSGQLVAEQLVDERVHLD
jgi:replicative DNA helicase